MKKYIFSLVCLCCALLPALEGQAALHEHPEYPDLRKSDANIVGHILDKNTNKKSFVKYSRRKADYSRTAEIIRGLSVSFTDVLHFPAQK